MTNNTANILVVDDSPDNLRLISAMLTEKGYTVRKALDGTIALTTIQKSLPDLILLDIKMPGINGYEVCQALKANITTQEIPIIFISALDDIADKVKGFKVGGVDYITKPFQREEVLVRVENQLIIRHQQKQLQQEIQERQKAEETLRLYLHAVSHDLRNPVVGLSMVLKNLMKRHHNEAKESKIPISLSTLEIMENSCDRLLKLINSLVETHQLEIWGVPLQCHPLNLHSLTQNLAKEWQPMLTQHQVILNNKIPTNLPLVYADSHQLLRVFENLISNAIKHNSPGITITLTAESITAPHLQAPMLCCTVADNGKGMEQKQAEQLFERYHRGNYSHHMGLGLGLYLCRQIITAHGGEIGVITHPNDGAKFWFSLPLMSKEGSRRNVN